MRSSPTIRPTALRRWRTTLRSGQGGKSMSPVPTRDALAEAASRLTAAGIDSARLDARVLLACAIGVAPEEVVGINDVDAGRAELFRAFVDRRAAREPLAYIAGKKEFYSREFAVGPGVLVPRPETETLIDEALQRFPDRNAELRVLDLGTGSGCLIVSFLGLFPNSRGVAVDVSEDALAWARSNIARHGLAPRCTVGLANWNASGRFDVILVNPPYLSEEEVVRAAPEVGLYEPATALRAGCDGLAAYRALAPQVASLLAEGGQAFLEIGAGQQTAVRQILEANGLEWLGFRPDLAGIPRCVIAGRHR